MFTGIIEEIGSIRHISAKGQAMELAVEATKVLEDVQLGDSISVNGVCLTVTSFDHSHFTADVMPETYRKTNLSQLTKGKRVNLERAMAANGRFGGHFVQGHVDGIGTIQARTREENAVVFTIVPQDPSLFKYIIDQGSIALDGISLTVVKAGNGAFTVSIIPHTLSQTVLQDKHVGDTVNIECDLLGKYVAHIMAFGKNNEHANQRAITEQFLRENGFI